MDAIFEKITKVLTLSLFIGTIIMLGMYCKRKFDTLELAIRQQSNVIQNIISLLSENETNSQIKKPVEETFQPVYAKVVVSDSEADSECDSDEEHDDNEIMNVTEMPSLEPIESVSLDNRQEKIEAQTDEITEVDDEITEVKNEKVEESERKEDELKINKMDLGENQYKHLKVPELKKMIEEKGYHDEMKTNMNKKEMIQLLLKHEEHS